MRDRRYREPERIGGSVEAVLRALRPRNAGPLERLRAAWPAIAGAEVAGKARLARLEEGVLRVELASAALRHHLATFRSGELLARLKEAVPEARLRALRFALSGGP